MKNKIKIKEDPTIDSLTIWINFNKCKIIDEKLISETRTYYESTNEISEIQPKKAIIIKRGNNTITYRIGIKQIGERKYIALTMSAKMLKEKYFEGITKENINEIYKIFIEEKIFKCEEETFKKALVMDIDICKTTYIKKRESFDRITEKIKRICKNNEAYINIEKKNEHKAIYLNTREKGTTRKPFVKLYFKEIELKTKSKEFKDKYLKKYEIENLVRYEATIKNGKTIKSLNKQGIIKEFKTLNQLLEIGKEELNKYIEYTLNQYKDNKILIEKEKQKMETPTEAIIRGAIKILIESEIYNIEEITEILKNEYRNKNTQVQLNGRYKAKKMIEKATEKLYNTEEEIRGIIDADEDLKTVLKMIGIEIQ